MPEYLIALGANLPSGEGSPKDTLAAALNLLKSEYVEDISSSRFYRTPCFPAGSGPDYVNAAARIRANLPPRDFLRTLHDVEALFGRERQTRWGMRTLDLDLLACGDMVHPDLDTFRHWAGLSVTDQLATAPGQLILPHPRIQDRAFVLVPLRDVAADWRHPVFNRTVEDMYRELPSEDLAGITPVDP